MDVSTKFAFVLISCFMGFEAVPPEACFANFRWEDCGRDPVPVMYYWKPGSRCEVGLWRGCLPNLNMFQDEYECVATCIFSSRAGEEDYHKILASEEFETTTGDTMVTEDDNCTSTRETGGTGVTQAGGTGGSNGTVASEGPGGNNTSGNTTTTADPAG